MPDKKQLYKVILYRHEEAHMFVRAYDQNGAFTVAEEALKRKDPRMVRVEEPLDWEIMDAEELHEFAKIPVNIPTLYERKNFVITNNGDQM